MSLSIGDKVKIKNHPNEVTGVVVKRKYLGGIWGINDYKYIVEYDEPYQDWPSEEYDEDHLILLEEVRKSYSNDCVCGAKYSRSFPDNHMKYCPKYRKF